MHDLCSSSHMELEPPGLKRTISMAYIDRVVGRKLGVKCVLQPAEQHALKASGLRIRMVQLVSGREDMQWLNLQQIQSVSTTSSR